MSEAPAKLSWSTLQLLLPNDLRLITLVGRVRFVLFCGVFSDKIYFHFILGVSFGYTRVGKGNLVLRSVLQNFRDIACFLNRHTLYYCGITTSYLYCYFLNKHIDSFTSTKCKHSL